MKRIFVDDYSLYTANGGRKYLNAAERGRVLAVMAALPQDQALFALTLAWTGARPSEVLALTPLSFQVESGIIAFRTLKRRKFSMREVPIPPALMAALDTEFALAAKQRGERSDTYILWPWSRTTAWRIIKRAMAHAQVAGRQACPRGLRHAFGVGTLQAGVPINLVQRWLGHARIETTAIYTAASGLEERTLAARFWSASRMPLDSVGPSGDQKYSHTALDSKASRSDVV